MRSQEVVTSFRFNLEDVEKFRELAQHYGLHQKALFKLIINSFEGGTSNGTLIDSTSAIGEYTALQTRMTISQG